MSGTDPIIPAFYSYPREPSSGNDLVPWARDMTRALQNQTRTVAERVNVVLQHGTAANRPAADGSRRLYYSTDTDKLSYDSGSWVDVGAGGAFIKNQTTLQAGSNFNISGNGLIGGTLGVGLTGPTEQLDVKGTSAVGMAIGDGAAKRLFISQFSGFGGSLEAWWFDANRRSSDGVFGDTSATHSRFQILSGPAAGSFKFFTTNTNNTNAGGLVPVLWIDGSNALITTGNLQTQRTAVTLVNGVNNDIGIGSAGYVCFTGPTAAFSVSGFTPVFDGRRLMITSEVAFAMTITNDAGSIAANRIYTGLGADQTGAATVGNTKEFIYNATLSRWCLSRAV